MKNGMKAIIMLLIYVVAIDSIGKHDAITLILLAVLTIITVTTIVFRES